MPKKTLSIIIASVQIFFVSPVFAQSTSPNYKVNEYQFGTGAETNLNSTSYKAQAGTGSLGVGNSSSTNFDSVAGFITPNEPFLEMVVQQLTLDLGTLSDTSTSSMAAQGGTCNCSFSVRTYLSSGYTVVTASQPPTSEGGSVLDAKTTLGVPSTDTEVEEFGINLVDNASPNIGANPSNQPDNTFADGQAATGYSTVDQFKYAVGDVIARSQATAGNPAVGLTYYTISYIAKRARLTQAGTYTLRHVLVAVPTY
ncbi:MAG: hypothetical protein AAB459_03620 [Patescibacteria group bacterium]